MSAVCILLFMNVEHESKKRNVPLGISRNPIFPIHITKCFRGHKKVPNISCVRIRKHYISIFFVSKKPDMKNCGSTISTYFHIRLLS